MRDGSALSASALDAKARSITTSAQISASAMIESQISRLDQMRLADIGYLPAGDRVDSDAIAFSFDTVDSIIDQIDSSCCTQRCLSRVADQDIAIKLAVERLDTR